MSELAENIKISFDNILKLYKEVTIMLQDVDSFMELEGYSVIGGNFNNAPISRSIHYPKNWLFPYVSRFYYEDNNPLLLKAVSIIFIDNNLNPIHPIILAGCFLFQSKDDGTANYHWETLQEAWFNNIEDQKFEKNYNTREGLKDVVKGIIRGIKIVSVQSLEDLENMIIKPLQSMNL